MREKTSQRKPVLRHILRKKNCVTKWVEVTFFKRHYSAEITQSILIFLDRCMRQFPTDSFSIPRGGTIRRVISYWLFADIMFLDRVSHFFHDFT